MTEPIPRNYVDPDRMMWMSPDGILHADLPRMLEVFGWEYTRENVSAIEAMLAEEVRERYGSIPVHVVSDLLNVKKEEEEV